MQNTRPGLLWLAIVFTVHSQFASGQSPQTEPVKTRITFELAKDTGLSDLLIQRREALAKRAGEPLKGHAWWLWGLSAFDYDRDGDDDLLVCIHGSTNGAILKNLRRESGRLTFADVTAELGVEGVIPSTDNYPLVWDFDGDGFLDIAGLLNDTNTPCLWNRAGKKFEKASFSLHPLNGIDALHDFNGDGFVDVLQFIRNKKVEFLYDSTKASFKKVETDVSPPANLPASVHEEIARLREDSNNRFLKVKYFHQDLNGDGQSDLAIQAFGAYSGARRGWYLMAEGPDRFEDRSEALGLPHDGTPMLLADVDHDGDIDVLIASGSAGGLYLNDSKGKFTLTPGPLTDFIKQKCPYLQVAFREDFDNDGDLDMALSSRRYGKEVILENLGGGRFATVLEARGWDADPLVLRDVDDDGRVDVLVGGAEGKESIGIYLNKTESAGRSVALSLRMESPNPYALGAKVELFSPGGLSSERPQRIEQAKNDGSPIYLGLATESKFDLRITFPGQKPLEFPNQTANRELQINPQGIVMPLP